MKRIIVDVDAGVDDAVAIFLLLFADKIGEIKLECISCTAGNTKLDYVTKNVVRLLEIVGRTDIPVYKGASEPFIQDGNADEHYHGIDGFGDLKHVKEPDVGIVKDEHASIAIARLIKDNPKQISLIAIGPLTTIALAYKLYPECAKNLYEVAIMGGNNQGVGNTPNAAEFNFYSDPEAAEIVLKNSKCPILLLPLETCIFTEITLDWWYNTQEKSNNELLYLIGRAEKIVYSKQLTWICCDAFLVAAFLYPNCITTQHSFSVSIELHGQKTRGQLVLDHRNKNANEYKPNVTVIEALSGQCLMDIFTNAALN